MEPKIDRGQINFYIKSLSKLVFSFKLFYFLQLPFVLSVHLSNFVVVISLQLFDRLRKERPNFSNKLQPICGDMVLPNLGLSGDGIFQLSIILCIVTFSVIICHKHMDTSLILLPTDDVYSMLCMSLVVQDVTRLHWQLQVCIKQIERRAEETSGISVYLFNGE